MIMKIRWIPYIRGATTRQGSHMERILWASSGVDFHTGGRGLGAREVPTRSANVTDWRVRAGPV
jgi:hypothetical protein